MIFSKNPASVRLYSTENNVYCTKLDKTCKNMGAGLKIRHKNVVIVARNEQKNNKLTNNLNLYSSFCKHTLKHPQNLIYFLPCSFYLHGSPFSLP